MTDQTAISGQAGCPPGQEHATNGLAGGAVNPVATGLVEVLEVIKGEPASWVLKVFEKGTGVALQVLGFLLILGIVSGSFHTNLHGGEFGVAFVGAVMLVVVGAAVSVCEYKREQDLHDAKVDKALRALEVVVTRTQGQAETEHTDNRATMSEALKAFSDVLASPSPVRTGK